MTLNKELFFPTPVFFQDIADADQLNAMLKLRIQSWREREKKGIIRSNVEQMEAWHSPTTMLTMPEFHFFIKRITGIVNQVFVEQRYHEGFVAHPINMWTNVNPKHAYNRSHTHPGSLWSGVYYVQTPEGCGKITFTDPRVQAQVQHTAVAPGDRGSEHWSEVHHQAIAGRVILFPSWLRHEVAPNLSDLPSPEGDRVSISFNYGQQSKES
ncbi:MAG: TIGR02466 family protein [Arenicella sp.]